jgi:hypothetical protein
VFCTRLVSRINAAGDGRRAVVVEVIVKRSVACAKFLLFEEERVIEQCESIENVETSLVISVSYTNKGLRSVAYAHLFRQNQCILHQLVQSCLEFGVIFLKCNFCCVVK